MTTLNDAGEKSKQFLEKAVKEFKIFIDTCSLLFETADAFWKSIVPILEHERKAIIVPYRVYEELKRFAENPSICAAKSPNNPNLNSTAVKVQKDVLRLQKAGLVEIFGDNNDNFADNVFQTVFTQYRLKYNLMLITQDSNLAKDIIGIGESKSVRTKNRILVERINKFGGLSMSDFRRTGSPRIAEVLSIAEDEKFAFSETIVRMSDRITVTYIPHEGDSVIAERNGNRKNVTLIKMIASGGEGAIFTTDIPNLAAKVYKKEKLDKIKHEKIKRMLTKKIDCEGICFPVACLYNSNDEFIGYLMPKAQGKELQKSVFIPALLKKNFPHWKKRDTVELCVTVLKKLKYLHERNVILGDINPNNILVVSPKEVYFVDTDSFQIEGFPCPVGTVNFTAPEIQRKQYGIFLRTMGNERFAVATLLFMIMLPGKPPYSLQGGENQIENIINMDFAYPLGEQRNGRTPDGMWRFCWSHLPYKLKEAFYQTFKKGEEHSTENTRYSTGDWLQKFEYFMFLLENGKFTGQDEMSAELFPTRFKKNKNATYIKCRLCGAEVDEETTEQGYCRECLTKGEIYQCARCGCELVYSNYQKLIRRSRKYVMCKECYDYKNTVYIDVQCSVCGDMFEITYGEKDFYEDKGYALPKKCTSCRRNARTNSVSQSQSSDYEDKNENSSGPCFITTAACEYFNKLDNCYELVTLRGFRDNWLAVQPSGEALIQEYYEIAPKIVKALEQNKSRDMIYGEIWENYISPCIKLIELTAYEACRNLYIEMLNTLKQKLNVKE